MMKIITAFLVAAIVVTSCQKSASEQYDALEKKELSSGKRYDSVFFGLYFGMTSKQFFTYCWEMSKKGIFTDGVNNQYVLHKLNNGELKHDATMNFYPDFFQDKIARVRVVYQYAAWAPWNKQLFSDSLLIDVLKKYEKDYPGNPFITIEEKGKAAIHAKVDGNRRIVAGIIDDGTVKVVITDLITEQQMKKQDAAKK